MTTWMADRPEDTCVRTSWRCNKYASPVTVTETVIDGKAFQGNWRPTKYATRRFPVRVEDGIRIETLVEMYHGAPSPYDNRYACRVTNEAGQTSEITDCDSIETAEMLALTFLALKDPDTRAWFGTLLANS